VRYGASMHNNTKGTTTAPESNDRQYHDIVEADEPESKIGIVAYLLWLRTSRRRAGVIMACLLA
jgi:hypothetical protein